MEQPVRPTSSAERIGAGLLDGVLLRNGDILAPYALLGLALLGFRRRSSRTLLAAAGILVVTPSLVEILVAAAGLSWPPRPTGAGGATWRRTWRGSATGTSPTRCGRGPWCWG